MKTLIPILCLLFLTTQQSIAQWSGTSPIHTFSQVGIGTTAPGAQLEVRSTLYGLEGPNGIATARFYGHIPDNIVYANTQNILEAYTVTDAPSPITTRQFVVDYSGFVGIGLGSLLPSQRLHVKGSAAITDRLGVGITSPVQPLHVEGTGYINGSLGIGTSNPVEKFQIGDRFTFHDGGTKIIGYNFDYDNGQGKRIVNDEVAMLAFDENGTVSIRTAPSGSPGSAITATNALWVRNDGRVGIGTATPGAGFQLDVAGRMRACEIRVEASGWCDYVFEENYPLMPLNEVSQFIKTHKHLPEIPSESEVLATGIDVGEMNQLLLKKVEELTLYVIQQEARLNELQEQLIKKDQY